MKKLIATLYSWIVLGLMAISAQNAPVTTIASVGACPNTIVSLPVTVTGFTNIGAASFTIIYNPAVLTAPTFTDNSLVLNLSYGSAPGVITVSGLSLTLGGNSLADGSTLFTLGFTFLGGNSNVSFDHTFVTTCQYGGPTPLFPILNDAPKATYYIDGQVTCETVAPTITCVATPQSRSTLTSSYTTVGGEFDPLTVSDNCIAPVTISNNLNGLSSLAGYVFPLGSTNVVWTATDACGNTSTCSFNVNVSGVVPVNAPVTTIQSSAGCIGQTVNFPVTVTGFTGIGAASYIINYNPAVLTSPVFTNTSGVLPFSYANPVAGTIAISGSSLLVGGHSLPNGSTLFTLSFTYLGGSSAVSFDHTFNTNCQYGGPTPTFNPLNDTPKSGYFIDGQVTCENVAPVISCVSSPQIRLTSTPNYTAIGTEFDLLSATDNCPGPLTITNNINGLSSLAGHTFGLGNTNVVWTVTDACGNAATCSFILEVQGAPHTTINNATSCPGSIVQVPVTVNDFNNIGAASFTINYNIGSLSNPTFVNTSGLLSLVFNNPVPGVITVSGLSLTPGGHSLPDGSTLFTLGFTYLGGTGSVAFDHTFVTNCQYGGPTPLFNALYDSPKSSYYTDGVVTCETVPPVVTCVGTPQIRHTGTGTYAAVASEFDPISVTDNCSPVVTYSNNLNGLTSLAGYVFPLGTTQVIWTATDNCGNIGTCSFDVTVQGAAITTIPSIVSCPGQTVSFPITVNQFNAIGAASFLITYNPAVLTAPTFVNTSGVLPLSFITPAAGTITVSGASLVAGGHTLPNGSVLFTLNFTYLGGTTAVAFDHTFNTNCQYGGPTPLFIPLYDTPKSAYFIDGMISCETVAPTLTCVSSPQIRLTGTPTYTTVGTEFDLLAYADNCTPTGSLVVSNNLNGTSTLAGYVFNIGTTNVVWTVTDGCGNTATCTFDVKVQGAPKTIIGTTEACPNTVVTIPVTVYDFNNIGAASMLINFNPGVLSNPVFTNNGIFPLTSFIPGPGQITVSGLTLNPGGISAPDGTVLFTLTFNFGVGSSAVAFDHSFVTNCQYGGPTPTFMALYDTPKSTYWTDGAINCETIAPVITSIPADLTVTCPNLVPAPNTGAVVATDNCVGPLTVTSNDVITPGPCPQKYVIARTYTVTDLCGNFAAQTQTITVDDNIAPTWVTALTALDMTLECSNAAGIAAAQAMFPVAIDNCDPDVTNIVKVSGAFVPGVICPQAGTYTNTWTVADDCGNVSAVYTQVITIFDATAPTWTTAGGALDMTLECSNAAGIAAAQAMFPVATDNCDADVTNIVKVSGAFVPGVLCPQAGTYTNTWTVADDCGNVSAVYTQVITIFDATAPTWTTAPGALDMTLECSNAAGIAAAQAMFPVASDNCDADVTNIVKVSGAFVPGVLCPQAGTYTNTWTVSDDCGNVSAVYTQVITIFDATAPTWTTAAGALDMTLECSNAAGIAAAQAMFPVATDNCDADVTNIVKVSGAFVPGVLCPQAGTYTNTWTVADDCGNVSAVYTQVITIFDATAPTWTTAAGALNMTLECSNAAGITAAQAMFPVATDNCDADVTNIVKVSGAFVPSLACPQAGTYTNTWTVADDCGNVSAVYTQVITIFDATAPTWTTAAGALDMTLECSNAAGITAAQAMFPVASDNCDADVTNIVKVSGAFVPGVLCPQAGTYTNTWTVADDCGNVSAVYTQVITIFDATAPTWTTAAGALDMTLECSNAAGIAAAQAMFPVAADNCDADVTNIVKVSGAFVPGVLCPQAGTYTNTWTVSDDCGNVSAVYTQVITIFDATAPTWTTAAGALDMTLECSNAAGIAAAQAMFPIAADNCDADVTNIVKVSGAFVPSLACPQAGTYTNTWTVADDCGNVSAVYTQVITIFDATAPTWTTAAGALDMTIECSNAAGIAAAQAMFPVAADNCDADVTNIVKVSGAFVPSLACPQAGTYTNTWTVADDCGNVSAVYTQVITIFDATAPTWTTVAGALDMTLECSNAAGIAAAQAMFPVAADNCDADVTNIVKVSGAFVPGVLCPQAGTYTNTWTVADDCGNVSAVYTQTITIFDATAPTWTTAAGALDVSVECSNAAGIAAAQALFPAATDNCDADVTNIVKVSGAFVPSIACPQGGTYTNTWTVADDCGNVSAVYTQTITIFDATAPTWTTAAGALDVSVECSNAAGIAAAQALFPVAADNCDADVTNIVKVSGAFVPSIACPQAGTYTNTWTVADDCGNVSAVYTQTITITDNTAPVLTAGAIATCYNSIAVAEAAAIAATSGVDNCSPVVTFTASTVGSCNAVITVVGADACGNTSSVTYSTRVDILAPVIAGVPATVTVSCDAVIPTFASTPAVSVTDDCDLAPSLTFVDATIPGLCPQSYTLTRTWTATDNCGNVAVAVQTIIVTDLVAPVISGVPAAQAVSCDAVIPAFAVASVSDNCDLSPSLTFVDATIPGLCPQSYTLTRTWTATDACGNVSVAVQTINVSDATAPVISALPAPSTINCPAPAILGFATPTATDNCDLSPSLTFVDVITPGACPQAYTVTRNWTATDACGNVSVASESISIVDIVPPSATCPPLNNYRNMISTLSPFYTVIGTEFDPTGLSDNCGVATATNNVNNGPTLAGYNFVSGIHQVIWTISDGCNVIYCTTYVQVDGYLPVSWLGFEGMIEGAVVSLEWQTASEINNSHFEVYRRHESEKEFSKIGSVTGAGNSTVVMNYDYSDVVAELPAGSIYYKLRQVDFDGKFDWSKTIKVKYEVDANNLISVYPVPSNGHVSVLYQGIAGTYTLEILNALGQVVKTAQIEGNQAELDLSLLPNGVYNIRMLGNGVDATKRIVISR
jgi:hypothetical protein